MSTQDFVARWTIGDTTPAGRECLCLSIASFLRFYNAKVVICHQCGGGAINAIAERFNASLHDQRQYLHSSTPPMGVAWKLYPPRLFPNQREVCIDNDIVFLDRIPQIETFLSCDCTLLLQGSSRNYGRFERHVPPGYCINSGIYGMPVGFNFQKYIKLYAGAEWEVNAFGEHAKSKTFDEQGLVAFALLNYGRFAIIPETTVSNCERHLLPGKGLHFVGLNRNQYHEPYRLFKSKIRRMYL